MQWPPNMQTCIQNLSHWCGWELSFLFWAYLYNFPFVIWLETQKMHASRQGWSCNPLVCQSTFNPWAIEEVGNIIVHSGSYCTVLYHNKRPKKVSHKADLIWQPLNPQLTPGPLRQHIDNDSFLGLNFPMLIKTQKGQATEWIWTNDPLSDSPAFSP